MIGSHQRTSCSKLLEGNVEDTCVTLEPGDVLIGHASLIHAGGAHEPVRDKAQFWDLPSDYSIRGFCFADDKVRSRSNPNANPTIITVTLGAVQCAVQGAVCSVVQSAVQSAVQCAGCTSAVMK